MCLKYNIDEDKENKALVGPEMVKQHSSAWNDSHKVASITGSTMFRAIVLSRLREQKEHHGKAFKGEQSQIYLSCRPYLITAWQMT